MKPIVSHPAFLSLKDLRRLPQLMAIILICLGFVLAGGARDDLISLLIWRPLTAIALVLSATLFGSQAFARSRPLMIFSLSLTGLVGLHLVPLPPSIWTALPGREIIVETYKAAGMALPWQPLSVAQARTWNALFALAGPLAVLMAVLTFDTRRHQGLLTAFIVIGFISGILGLIQAIGPAGGPLYFYRVTNATSSVGLFANRNHQAVFLATLFPLLAARYSLFQGAANRLAFHRATMLAGAALLVPLILMTGSRSGLLLGVIGVGLGWWVHKAPAIVGRVDTVRKEWRTRIVGWTVLALLVVVLVVIAARTPALQRLLDTDSASELRVQAMPTVLHAIRAFMPFGSGVGTFVEVYQIFEPDRLISYSYLNHAHNDFAEIALTGGIPALLLLGWILAMLGNWTLSLVRIRQDSVDRADLAGRQLGRAGASVLIMLALASVVDYPLRTPSILIYAVVMAVWCATASKAFRK